MMRAVRGGGPVSLDWRVVPIQRWPTEPTRNRQRHPFGRSSTSSIDWGGTTDLLDRELRMLGAKRIVLQLQVTDEDIRNDGWIRASARPSSPGVILTFDSKHGPLSYPCDQFTDWQANVRAIALALEALRKVDRYGVTKRGEQYTGWKQLPPAGGSTPTMTAEVAAGVMETAAQNGGLLTVADAILRDLGAYVRALRPAAKGTHPDSGGSVADFQLFQEAKRVLDRHHGIKP